MPERYRPAYKWEVDWDGDGAFSHPQSDISDLLLQYDIRFGAEPNVATDAVVPSAALGFINTDNRTQVLDPDSNRQLISRSQAFARNGARLVIDDELWWQGIITFDRKDDTYSRESIRWQLDSVNGNTLRDSLLFYSEGGTVGTMLAELGAQTGVQFVASLFNQSVPIGTVSYDGGFLPFLEQLQTFIGGFVIEDYVGGSFLQDYPTAGQLPLNTTFTAQHEGLRDQFRRATKAQHARSEANTEYNFFVEREESEVLYRRNLSLVSGGRLNIVVDDVANRSSRPIGWDSFVVDVDNVAVVVWDRVAAQEAPLSVPISIFTNNTAEPITEVTLIGTGRRAVLTTGNKVLVSRQRAIGQPRAQEYPAWFNANFDGLASHVRPWLEVLRNPPQHLTTAYKSWQETQTLSRDITSGGTPGTRCQFYTLIDGVERDVNALVLQARVTWRLGQPPVHFFESIVTDNLNPPDLFLDGQAVDFTTIQALASIREARSGNIYERHRTS